MPTEAPIRWLIGRRCQQCRRGRRRTRLCRRCGLIVCEDCYSYDSCGHHLFVTHYAREER